MNLWLDDVRPAPEGWVHVKTADEAKALLQTGNVQKASLDHDLGACETCFDGLNFEEWHVKYECKSAPHCEHFGTGYTLLCWMEETDIWPAEKPTVHSANPVGRDRMQQVIDRKYG